MRVLMVLLVLWLLCACKKEKCYDCKQIIRWSCNKEIKGLPKEITTKIVSCGQNIDIIDNPQPIVVTDTVGDTIYTYSKDTDCRKR